MFEKFDWMLARYQELSEAVSQPEIIADQARWQRLLKEHAALEPAVEAYRAYQKTLSDLAEAREMLSQPDMAELAQDEVNRLEAEKQRQEYELRLLLLPRDPDADKNVVMEIRQGAGGDEAALFGALLLRMYTRYAERHRFRVEPVSYNMTELGGVKEAVFTIVGEGAFSRLKFESGVHRVQRVPSTESGGRIHTSTCTVAVLPEVEDLDVTIDPRDLRIDVYRSTGHGGQCVNTHRQRRAHHPPAHGAGGDLSGREKPDQEPRQGHARAQEPPLRQAARGTGQRLRPEPPRPDRHRRPERAHPHLQLSPGPA